MVKQIYFKGENLPFYNILEQICEAKSREKKTEPWIWILAKKYFPWAIIIFTMVEMI